MTMIRSNESRILRPILILGVVLSLYTPNLIAQDRDLDSLNWEFDHSPIWQEPALYSARIMSIGIAGLVSLDLHEHDPSVDNFLGAMRSPRPRPDDDGPMFNLVLHPLWGSETYLRARDADMSMAGSFAFSMSASVIWEYFIESWTEHPSSQDLVYTTGLGWMLGEARYRLLQVNNEKYRYLIDPLNTTLKYVNMSFRVNEAGEATPLLNVQWSI